MVDRLNIALGITLALCLDMSRDMSTAVRAVPEQVAPLTKIVVFILTGHRAEHVIDGTVRIGRSSDCDLQVADEAISRVHLEITRSGDHVTVKDLDSRNGTFIDGRLLRGSTTLTAGVIRFGDTVAVIAAGREHNAHETADSPLIGGAALSTCRRIVSLVAPTDLPLLVTGETGTGKEVIARWAHQLSKRSGPLIPVNCAALPESLLEAELFGHVRGAFTGATHASRGLIAAADSGTLFLDEVGELPLAVQAKLLRVLEDRVVRPLGSDGAAGRPTDFRVISATNVDLQDAVARGAFRADLYARLAAVVLAPPPLREHIEDLPLLIEHLLRKTGVTPRISPDALEAMVRYRWPQNVRQLDYALRRSIAMASTSVELEHLPEELRFDFRKTAETPQQSAPPARAAITREDLEAALRSHHGNVRQVGKALAIPRSRLYRLLKQWSLDPVVHRPGTGGTTAANREDPS